MGSTLCLSLTPILRCESLSRIQNDVLLVPPALGVIFASVLVIAKWGSGRTHLLLAVEGWLTFILSLIDFLSHILPTLAQSMQTFKILDMVIGALSFLPLFLYTLFLFLLARSQLIPQLPGRFQRLTLFVLAIFVPAIIALNEIGSFLGISYRYIPVDRNSTDPNGPVTLAVGFSSADAQSLWTFFNSFTLALFTAFQAIVFALAFYRLVKAFIDQRRIETQTTDENERHLFRGTGWVMLGAKLGAVEAVVGFAQEAGFGGILTRRILRFVSRACLIIGAVKGMDSREDFEIFTERDPPRPEPAWRRSNLRALISNPRNSTFVHMSPTAATFYEAPRAAHYTKKGKGRAEPFVPFNESGPSGMQAGERVTVLLRPGTAPLLEMRFSALDMPSPTELVQDIKTRHQSLEIPREPPSASKFTEALAYPVTAVPDFPSDLDAAKQRASAASVYSNANSGAYRYSYRPPTIYDDNSRHATARELGLRYSHGPDTASSFGNVPLASRIGSGASLGPDLVPSSYQSNTTLGHLSSGSATSLGRIASQFPIPTFVPTHARPNSSHLHTPTHARAESSNPYGLPVPPPPIPEAVEPARARPPMARKLSKRKGPPPPLRAQPSLTSTSVATSLRTGTSGFSPSPSVSTAETDAGDSDPFAYDNASEARRDADKAKYVPSVESLSRDDSRSAYTPSVRSQTRPGHAASMQSEEWVTRHSGESQRERQISAYRAAFGVAPGSRPASDAGSDADELAREMRERVAGVPWRDSAQSGSARSEEEAVVETAWRSTRPIPPGTGVARVKSVGTVAQRHTPTPTHAAFAPRASVTLEKMHVAGGAGHPYRYAGQGAESEIEEEGEGPQTRGREDSVVLGADDRYRRRSQAFV